MQNPRAALIECDQLSVDLVNNLTDATQNQSLCFQRGPPAYFEIYRISATPFVAIWVKFFSFNFLPTVHTYMVNVIQSDCLFQRDVLSCFDLNYLVCHFNTTIGPSSWLVPPAVFTAGFFRIQDLISTKRQHKGQKCRGNQPGWR